MICRLNPEYDQALNNLGNILKVCLTGVSYGSLYRGEAMSFTSYNFPTEKFLMHYVQYVLAFRGILESTSVLFVILCCRITGTQQRLSSCFTGP